MDPYPSTQLVFSAIALCSRLGASLFAAASSRAILYISVLVVLILLSGFFSASETAFTSLNRIRLKSLESSGNKKATKVLKLLENYDRLLSTILIGNNIVNITAASLATLLFVNEIMAGSSLAPLVATVVLTVVVLIFGEITPKSLAKESPERFAMTVQPILRLLIIIFIPFNAGFWVWKKVLIKLFRLKKTASVTEDELITMIEEVESEGGLEKHESQLIRSAIEFDDVDVGDVMIPRVKVVAIEDDESMEEIAKIFFDSGFSRLPVYNDSIDQVIGIIHEKDFSQLYRDGGTSISGILAESVCLSENMKISDALRLLQKNKTHMAVVVDEFGGTAGIITMEDILEELVGEIWDEHDEVEINFKKIDDNTYIIDGVENFEDMTEFLEIDCKEEYESTTVGGWITEILKRIPSEGESFKFYGYNFEVVEASAKSVLSVRATFIGNSEEVSDD